MARAPARCAAPLREGGPIPRRRRAARPAVPAAREKSRNAAWQLFAMRLAGVTSGGLEIVRKLLELPLGKFVEGVLT